MIEGEGGMGGVGVRGKTCFGSCLSAQCQSFSVFDD